MTDLLEIAKGVPLVSRHLDRRALKLAEELAPRGSKHGPAVVSGHTVKRKRLGSRKIEVEWKDPATKRNIGSVDAMLYPGRHVQIGHMGVDPDYRGKGIGGTAAKEMASRAQTSKKVRSIGFMAFGDRGGEASMSGARAWRRSGAKYTPGGGIRPNWDPNTREKVQQLSDAEKKQVKRYKRRAAMRMQKPHDLAGPNKPKYMSEAAAESLRGAPWFATMKGGRSSTDKVVVGTAAGAGAGAGAMKLRQDKEQRHAVRE